MLASINPCKPNSAFIFKRIEIDFSLMEVCTQLN